MSERLSRRAKLIYGSGDIGFSLTSTILGAYFLIFLTDIVGLPPGLAAIAIFCGRSWDYINDPLFGYLSDRTRTRWGKRRPYLLFGPLPFAVAFMLLWWRPPWDSTAFLVAYYACAYVVFDAAATLVYMPYFALTPELSADYDERTSLTSYRMFFSIAGSLLAFTIPLVIIGTFEPQNAPRVLFMGALFGLVSALPLFGVFAHTKEQPQHQAAPPSRFLPSLRAALTNQPFVFGLVLFLCTWVAVEILQATLLFFIKYVLERQGQSDLFMAAIFVTAILALPLWTWASRRWSKRWAYVGGISFWAIVQLGMIALQPTTPLPVILGMCVLAGVGVSAAHILPWAILPDAIEWGEWKTGERHEGVFYSLVTLAHKVTASLAVPAVGIVLQLTGYVPNSASQPPTALRGIRLVIGPLPAILLGLGITFALLYPLGRDGYNQLIDNLQQRAAEPASEDMP